MTVEIFRFPEPRVYPFNIPGAFP